MALTTFLIEVRSSERWLALRWRWISAWRARLVACAELAKIRLCGFSDDLSIRQNTTPDSDGSTAAYYADFRTICQSGAGPRQVPEQGAANQPDDRLPGRVSPSTASASTFGTARWYSRCVRGVLLLSYCFPNDLSIYSIIHSKGPPTRVKPAVNSLVHDTQVTEKYAYR